MARSSFIIVIGIWVLQVVPFSNDVYAVAQSTCRAIDASSASLNTPLFLHENGLVDVDINEVPLGTILDQFKAQFGIRVKLHDPSMAYSPVSIALKGSALEEAIKAVLKRVSYVLYPEGNSFVLIVLSTDQDTTRTHGRVTYEPEPTAHPATLSDITEDGEFVDTFTGYKATWMPKSLDEFQPITMEGFSSGHTVEGQEGTDPSEQLEAEQKYEEALIQRALAAINSQYEHLHEEATNQLIGVNDPRATEILVDASRTATDSISRAQAVDALRRHAENLQLTDVTSIDALKQLAEDRDLNVSNIARQALRGVDKFQTENRSQNYKHP